MSVLHPSGLDSGDGHVQVLGVFHVCLRWSLERCGCSLDCFRLWTVSRIRGVGPLVVLVMVLS